VPESISSAGNNCILIQCKIADLIASILLKIEYDNQCMSPYTADLDNDIIIGL